MPGLNLSAYTSVIRLASNSMLTIGIRFKNPDVTRWLAALERIEFIGRGYIENEMQRRCSLIYANMVISNILSDKFGAKQPPSPAYSDRYAKWKKAYFPQYRPWGTWVLDRKSVV